MLEAETVVGSVHGFGTGIVGELLQHLEIAPRPFEVEHVVEAKVAYRAGMSARER